MRVLMDLITWLVAGQLALLLLFQFAENQANALYVFFDFSLFYGGSILIGIFFLIYIILRAIKGVQLKGVGQKSGIASRLLKEKR